MIPDSDASVSGDSPILGNLTKIASHGEISPLILKFYLQSLARELLPDERVSKCLRQLAPGRNVVKLMYSPRVSRAHYKNLYICARLWICPVCASRITEVRREELTAATAAPNHGHLLVTYTLRHSRDDNLSQMLDAVRESYRSLKSGREWQAITARCGWVGSVSALEVTHGENGWHPHFHELVFVAGGLHLVDLEQLKNDLKQRWSRVLERHGRDASWDYGVDVRIAQDDIKDYVAKFGHEPVLVRWTIAHEVAKAAVKNARAGGRTPRQLLADYGAGDKHAGELYLEYAAAFKGRNHLVWSRGLRRLLNLEQELTDEQIAQDVQEDSYVLALLTRQQWQVILGNDARGELLEVAAAGDAGLIADFLELFGIEAWGGESESDGVNYDRG